MSKEQEPQNDVCGIRVYFIHDDARRNETVHGDDDVLAPAMPQGPTSNPKIAPYACDIDKDMNGTPNFPPRIARSGSSFPPLFRSTPGSFSCLCVIITSLVSVIVLATTLLLLLALPIL